MVYQQKPAPGGNWKLKELPNHATKTGKDIHTASCLDATQPPANASQKWVPPELEALKSHPISTESHTVKQSIVTLDLEGVLVPEIWIAVAEKTGIKELRLTTRDIPDYDVLMKGRLMILDEHKLKLADIQKVIDTLSPLPGALEFLNELRTLTQVLILSDTFEEFAQPLMRQLGWPTIFCHRLEVIDGRIVSYKLRQVDQKRKSVAALRGLGYHVVAAGDSFNDTTMLAEANTGYLFHSPDSIKKQFPHFKALETYGDLLGHIRAEI